MSRGEESILSTPPLSVNVAIISLLSQPGTTASEMDLSVEH